LVPPSRRECPPPRTIPVMPVLRLFGGTGLLGGCGESGEILRTLSIS
jgi:hypothetical protein